MALYGVNLTVKNMIPLSSWTIISVHAFFITKNSASLRNPSPIDILAHVISMIPNIEQAEKSESFKKSLRCKLGPVSQSLTNFYVNLKIFS